MAVVYRMFARSWKIVRRLIISRHRVALSSAFSFSLYASFCLRIYWIIRYRLLIYFPSFIFVAWPTRFKNTTHQIKLDEFWEFALYYCISAYGVIRILRYCDFLWFSANGQFWRSWCCILSRFSVEIKTIFLALSIMFYLHYFVLSIIIDNKIDNIDPII